MTAREKKDLLKTVLWFVIASALLAVRAPLTAYPSLRYLCQCLVAAAVVFYFLFLRSLRRAIPQSVRDRVNRAVARTAEVLTRAARSVTRRIRKLLGLPDPVRRRDRDERSFRFTASDEGAAKRVRYAQKTLKWRDLESNAERIRYIYVKYVIQSVRRGFRFSDTQTPHELAARLDKQRKQRTMPAPLTDTERRLFDLYDLSRYGNTPNRISEEDVTDAAALIRKKA